MAQEPEIISQTVTQDTTTSYSYQWGWRWGWWNWNWGWGWNWGNWYRNNWSLGWNTSWWGNSNWGWWNWNNWSNWGWGGYYPGVWGGWNWGWNWGWWYPWARVVRTTTTTTTTATDRVLAKNEIPFMRTKDVNFSVSGLRPYTKFYPFFDNTLVSNYCRSTSFNGKGSTSVGSNILSGMTFASGDIETGWKVTGPGIPDGTTVTGIGSPVDGTISQVTLSSYPTLNASNQPYTFTNGTTTFGSALVSDGNGNLRGQFRIPNDSNLKFRVGARVFRVSDVMNPAVEDESSWADALYIARGVIEDRQKTVFRDVTIRTDPLAQSFITDGKESDGGIMVTGVGVYFSTKDSTVPVTCELRKMVNGYPGEELVHELARTSLDAADIITSTDASVETVFYFSRPIYLEQDTDYCFVLRSSSNKYNVYIATMGQLKLNSIQSVSKQPYIGSLFLSQNNSTWTADQWSDMKFNVYKAQFDISKTPEVVFKNVVPEFKFGSGPVCELTAGSTTVVIRAPEHGYNSSGINPSKASIRVNAFQGDITNGSPTVTGVPNAVIDRINASITAQGGNIPVGLVFSTDTGVAAGTTISSGTTGISGFGTLTLSANSTATGTRELSYGYIKIDNVVGTALEAYKICGSRTVTWADSRTFTVAATSAPSAGGVGWVDSIILEPDTKLDVGFLNAGIEEFPGVSVSMYKKSTTGMTVDGSQIPYQKDSAWMPVAANANMEFNAPMVIASQANLTSNPSLNGSSFDVKAVLKSTNPNLSPVINGDSVSLITIANLLSNPDQTIDGSGSSNRPYDHEVYVVTATTNNISTNTISNLTINRKFGSDTIAQTTIAKIRVGAKVTWSNGSSTVVAVTPGTTLAGSSITLSSSPPSTGTPMYFMNIDTLETSTVGGITPSKYIIKPVKLETPATSLRVMFSGNIVTGNYVDVYYKTLAPSSTTTLDTTQWKQMSLASGTFKNANNKDEFIDYTFEVKSLSEFQTFQVKIVMRGTDSSKPPRIKEFRTLALAV